MKKCPYCAEEVQDEAIKCKHCGNSLNQTARSAKRMFKIIGITVVAFFVLMIGISAVALLAPSDVNESSKPEAGFKMPSIGSKIVTFDEYDKIQNGISYAQVVAIVGAEGEELTRSKMDGVPGVMDSLETVMYQWVNINGSNMNVMFQNDKLIQKAQFGLK